MGLAVQISHPAASFNNCQRSSSLGQLQGYALRPAYATRVPTFSALDVIQGTLYLNEKAAS